MSNFNSWWSTHTILKENEFISEWKSAFMPFLTSMSFDSLPEGELRIEEQMPQKHIDYGHWLQRAFLRKDARSCFYDEENDLLESGHIYWNESGFEEEHALLPLTWAGTEKALFLDRDGIINIDNSYIFKFDDISFMPGIEKIISLAKERGYKIIVLTNQSGVGRGLYTEADVLKLHQKMGDYLKDKNAQVDGWYYSPYHPESSLKEYKRSSYTRKPMPGMAIKAARDWNIDLSRSFMIGDKVSDILAHLDIKTFLLKGNYELGAYSPQFKSLEDLRENLKVIL